MGAKFHSYSYPEVQPGFAEVDLEEYDQVSASLAWTRTLAAVRKGFEINVDLEKVWEEHIARECPRATTTSEKVCMALIPDLDSGVCHQRRGRHHGYDGGGALCQSCPHSDGRYWISGPSPILS